MNRLDRLLACLAIAISSACHSSSDASVGSPEPPKNGRFVIDAQHRKICELPLSEYCKDKPCQTFSQSVIAARALVSRTEMWSVADIGTCGAVKYVHRGAWYMHETEYFDGDKLVGAKVGVDNLGQFCDGKTGVAHYGNVPSCIDTPTETILDGGPIP